MIKLFNFLITNKKRNFLLLTIYYLLVVLPHEQVGLLAVKIFGKLTRSNYNLTILALCLLLVLTVFSFVFKPLKNHKEKNKIIFYTVATFVFAALCFNYLFVVNIEAIHFVQYAGFAILCFPLLKNFPFAFIYSTLAGAFDEAFQYFYLSPERTDYYDLNDVIINAVGAGFGLILIKIFYKKNLIKINFKAFVKSKLAIILGVLFIVIFVLTATNIIPFASPTISKSGFYWFKKVPSTFFTKIYPNILYHIVMPFEALIMLLFLTVFYSRLNVNSKH